MTMGTAENTIGAGSVKTLASVVYDLHEIFSLNFGVPLSQSQLIDANSLPPAFRRLNAINQIYVAHFVNYTYQIFRWFDDVYRKNSTSAEELLRMFPAPPPHLYLDYIETRTVETTPFFSYMQSLGFDEGVKQFFGVLETLINDIATAIENGIAPFFDTSSFMDNLNNVLPESGAAIPDLIAAHEALLSSYGAHKYLNVPHARFQTESIDGEILSLCTPSTVLAYSNHVFFPFEMNMGVNARIFEQTSYFTLISQIKDVKYADKRMQRAMSLGYFPQNLTDKKEVKAYSLFSIYMQLCIYQPKSMLFAQQAKNALEEYTRDNRSAMEFYLRNIVERPDRDDDIELVRDAYLVMMLHRYIAMNRTEIRNRAIEIMLDEKYETPVRFGMLNVYMQQVFAHHGLNGSRSESQFFTDAVKEIIETEISQILRSVNAELDKRKGVEKNHVSIGSQT